MPLLALDTATLVSSVALAGRDRLLAELTIQIKKTHSEKLMPNIEELLAAAGTGREDLEAIAVSIGPGSFTGLRIGLATAKALAYALNIPLVGVSTLAALAYGCPVAGALLAPTMDAQKGNIYYALYRWQDGALTEVAPPSFQDGAIVAAELADRGEPVLILGEAVELFPDIFRRPGLSLALPHIAMPRAASVAFLGFSLLDAGAHHDVMTLEPLYIRRSEAEELWEKRHSKCQSC